MHPDICSFPSAAFYQGRLRSHPTPSDRPAPPGFPWPVTQVGVTPVALVPVPDGQEQRSSSEQGELWEGERHNGAGHKGQGASLYNDLEARQVVSVVQRLLAGGGLGGGAADIGIITPYNAQVRHIQRLLQEVWGERGDAGASGGPRGQRSAGSSAGDSAEQRARWLEQLEVKSVDGFQVTRRIGLFLMRASRRVVLIRGSRACPGISMHRPTHTTSAATQGREKEVIIFSAVRSNARGALGFLTDSRRLNVALTRARRGLVVVGNPETLKQDRVWAAWLSWAQEHRLWLSGPLAESHMFKGVGRSQDRRRD
ncbi:hypothetical protein QJQ45_016770, partial [Haematococcus lacustris]